ncbi:hypothetical protein BN1708_019565, partial [Verticillium longisporum]
HDRQHLLSRS